MAERYLFFDSTPTDRREYNSQDFALYFNKVLSDGLFSVDGNPILNVKVEDGTLNYIVTEGSALIKGHLYVNTSDLNKTFENPDPDNDRIDRIVLQLDLSQEGRFIKVVTKTGVPSSDPVAPELVRDEAVYELSLGQILVKKNTASVNALDYTDERLDEELCGIVNSQITAPTEAMQQQFDAWFDSIKAGVEGDVNEWVEHQQKEFIEWTEGSKEDFDDWFESIKGSLEGDVATSLFNKIDKHEKDDEAHGIGDKKQLKTTEKETIVGAVNELFTNVSDGKSKIASAITDKGLEASSEESFDSLSEKIINLPSGINDVEEVKGEVMDVLKKSDAVYLTELLQKEPYEGDPMTMINRVEGTEVSPDGRYLAITTYDDLHLLEILPNNRLELFYTKRYSGALHVTFMPDSRHVFVGVSLNGSLESLLEIDEESKEVKVSPKMGWMSSYYKGPDFSSDGSTFSAGSNNTRGDDFMDIFRQDSLGVFKRIYSKSGFGSTIDTTSISPTDGSVALGGRDYYVHVLFEKDGNYVKLPSSDALSSYTGYVTYSPDGKYLVVTSRGSSPFLTVFKKGDKPTDKYIKLPNPAVDLPSKALARANFSESGTSFQVATSTKLITYDIKDGTEIIKRPYEDYYEPIESMAFGKDEYFGIRSTGERIDLMKKKKKVYKSTSLLPEVFDMLGYVEEDYQVKQEAKVNVIWRN